MLATIECCTAAAAEAAQFAQKKVPRPQGRHIMFVVQYVDPRKNKKSNLFSMPKAEIKRFDRFFPYSSIRATDGKEVFATAPKHNVCMYDNKAGMQAAAAAKPVTTNNRYKQQQQQQTATTNNRYIEHVATSHGRRASKVN